MLRSRSFGFRYPRLRAIEMPLKNQTETDQRRDKLLLRLLKMPPSRVPRLRLSYKAIGGRPAIERVRGGVQA